MAPTAAQIAQLRRMTALLAGDATYTDAILTAYIETYPVMDERGEYPYTWDSATPPAKVTNTNWVETYDLNAAAADVWEEKATAWITQYSFTADGGNYSRSDVYENMMKQARHYRARRVPKTMTAVKWPEEPAGDTLVWIANLPEPHDP